jgi:uncharacterized protein YqfA (UPF0365 family)
MSEHVTLVTFIIFLISFYQIHQIMSYTPTSAIGLCLKRLGQSSNLLVKELLGLLPDTRVGPVVESEKAGQKGLAEHLGALAGEEGGKVVDADHAQRRAALQASDGDCGLVEGGGDIVQGDGVEGVGAKLVSRVMASHLIW